MKYKWPMILTILVLLLNSGTALAGGDHQTALLAPALNAASTRTVRITTPEPVSIDPATATDFTIPNQLFSGLTRIDPVTDAPIPDLASSWSVSLDATQFIFTLRNGLTWSNGTPITANDVKYGILRSLNPATGSNYAYVLYVIQNAEDYNNGAISDPNLVGITVLSNTQIQFTLESSASYFPAILALPAAFPMPATAIATWGTTWTEPGHIVTSGPYRLTEWVHNNRMLLEKFTSFYDAPNVQIDKVSVKLTDEMTAWNLFLSGNLDRVNVPSSVLSAVRADPTLSPMLHTVNTPCTYYYGFSIDEPPFNNLLVRKAFIASVNRQGLIDSVLGGVQEPALTFTPPNVFGHVDGFSEGVGIPYNPSQAQQWLSDAGYPNGTGLPPITLWYNTSTGHQSIAEYIRQNWTTNLNVTVTLQSLPWDDYRVQINDGDFQIWRLGWCIDYNDAYNFLYESVDPLAGRYGGWMNATYQNYLSQAAQSDDNTTRQLYYKQAEEILVETDAVMLPIYFYGFPVVTRPYLQMPDPSQNELYIRDWFLTAPMVDSIIRASANPTSAASVDFTVNFSEAVIGVDSSDFSLTTKGVTGASILAVSGTGTTYTVTVNTGTGSVSGTIRLDLRDDDSIHDLDDNPLGGIGVGNGDFFGGEVYNVLATNIIQSLASQDGHIFELRENSNTGWRFNANSARFYIGDDNRNRQYLSILSFNTSSLPDDAVILSATLNVKRARIIGTNPFDTHGALGVEIGSPCFGSSCNLEASDFQADAQDVAGLLSSFSVDNWHSAVIGSNVFPYIDLTGTTQFRLRFELDDNNDRGMDSIQFLSGNAPADDRPQLIIEYYVP